MVKESVSPLGKEVVIPGFSWQARQAELSGDSTIEMAGENDRELSCEAATGLTIPTRAATTNPNPDNEKTMVNRENIKYLCIACS
jgi:hypothetical protein